MWIESVDVQNVVNKFRAAEEKCCSKYKTSNRINCIIEAFIGVYTKLGPKRNLLYFIWGFFLMFTHNRLYVMFLC